MADAPVVPLSDVGLPTASPPVLAPVAAASPAPTPVRAPSSGTSDGGITKGHWTDREHQLFELGMRRHDRKWDLVAKVVGTRTQAQVRSHAQKHFKKPMKAKLPIEIKCTDGPGEGQWLKFATRTEVVSHYAGQTPTVTKQTLATLLGKGLEYEVRRSSENGATDGTPIEVRPKRPPGQAWSRFKSMDEAAKRYSPPEVEGEKPDPAKRFTVHHISALLNSHFEARYAAREEVDPDAAADASRDSPAKKRRRKSDAGDEDTPPPVAAPPPLAPLLPPAPAPLAPAPATLAPHAPPLP